MNPQNIGMCNKSDHVAGQIGSKVVKISEWNDAVIAFGLVIHDFNIRGQRDQINHPGWCSKFKFCPQCGGDLRHINLRDLVINS